VAAAVVDVRAVVVAVATAVTPAVAAAVAVAGNYKNLFQSDKRSPEQSGLFFASPYVNNLLDMDKYAI
jgi:hypothetical protein